MEGHFREGWSSRANRAMRKPSRRDRLWDYSRLQARGALKNGARDLGAVCNNSHTAIKVNDEGIMVFRLFDWFDTGTRRMEGENMIFTFIDGVATRTERFCEYPQNVALVGLKN